MRNHAYVLCLALLNACMVLFNWGALYLASAIVLTFCLFRVKRLLHPSNIVFGFAFLYVSLPCAINFFFEAAGWKYVLPWGQVVFWDRMSLPTLFQIEFDFLFLFFGLRAACEEKLMVDNHGFSGIRVNKRRLATLIVAAVAFVLLFIQLSGGWMSWLLDYSNTYLTKRSGLGLVNLVQYSLGTVCVFLLGVLLSQAARKWPLFLGGTAFIAFLSVTNGIKSRFLFLLLLFVAPLIVKKAVRIARLFFLLPLFIVLLYVGSLFRTEGFYSSANAFAEMMVDYFNTYQLHDDIVKSEPPGVAGAVFPIYIRPLQVVGLIPEDVDYDLSISLTKKYFPDQWYVGHGTQQWPLETYLYLNYAGPLLSWLPLLLYLAYWRLLYRKTFAGSAILFPIYMLELLRIFSTMRSSFIPWDIVFTIPTYVIIYAATKFCFAAGGKEIAPRLPCQSLRPNASDRQANQEE